MLLPKKGCPAEQTGENLKFFESQEEIIKEL
jgi:hypothetical protein